MPKPGYKDNIFSQACSSSWGFCKKKADTEDFFVPHHSVLKPTSENTRGSYKLVTILIRRQRRRKKKNITEMKTQDWKQGVTKYYNFLPHGFLHILRQQGQV